MEEEQRERGRRWRKRRLKREEKEKGVEKRVGKSEENVEAACDRTVCVYISIHV